MHGSDIAKACCIGACRRLKMIEAHNRITTLTSIAHVANKKAAMFI